jgi:hypothetical protein
MGPRVADEESSREAGNIGWDGGRQEDDGGMQI